MVSRSNEVGSKARPGPRVCFYADDFTGASDALTQFTRFGLSSVLLFKLPSAELLFDHASRSDVLGIAGLARTLDEEDLRDELTPVFESFAGLKPQFVQYKTSSTMDSSVSLGSIGAAVDTGLAVFGEMPVPVLAAQPGLGRYTVFANQFASTSQERVSRLDRHTASSEHAVTPMRESDVRRLLGSQTRRDVLSIDWRLVSEGGNGLVQAWRAVERGQLAVFDSLSGDDVRRIGGLLAAERGSGIQFGVGSGGLSLALASTLGRPVPVARHAPVPAASLLAVSGSASGHTRDQIRYVTAQREWSEVIVDPQRTGDPEYGLSIKRRVVKLVRAQQAVIVHPLANERSNLRAPTDSLGHFLGRLVRACLTDVRIDRLVIAGGDTSGRVLRQLDFHGARVQRADFAPGVSLLTLWGAPGTRDLPALLKGGQAGPVSFFEDARLDRAHAAAG